MFGFKIYGVCMSDFPYLMAVATCIRVGNKPSFKTVYIIIHQRFLGLETVLKTRSAQWFQKLRTAIHVSKRCANCVYQALHMHTPFQQKFHREKF